MKSNGPVCCSCVILKLLRSCPLTVSASKKWGRLITGRWKCWRPPRSMTASMIFGALAFSWRDLPCSSGSAWALSTGLCLEDRDARPSADVVVWLACRFYNASEQAKTEMNFRLKYLKLPSCRLNIVWRQWAPRWPIKMQEGNARANNLLCSFHMASSLSRLFGQEFSQSLERVKLPDRLRGLTFELATLTSYFCFGNSDPLGIYYIHTYLFSAHPTHIYQKQHIYIYISIYIYIYPYIYIYIFISIYIYIYLL